jgi:hypothetical protein
MVEQLLNKNDLIIVDVQPEYEKYIPFTISNFCKWINKNYKKLNSILFLYNGKETLDMISELDLKMWYVDNGLDENIVENSEFYDKGYAFFRYCIDNNISDEDIVLLVKYMKANNVYDSRQIKELELWDEFSQKYSSVELRDLLEHSDDLISIPDVMDIIKKYKNIVLVGGGANECLKEIEIALLANDQSYNQIAEWIY